MRMPTSSTSYTVWWVGSPRLAGDSVQDRRWRAAEPTPTSGMRDPSEKETALVQSLLVRGPSWDWTKRAATSFLEAMRARILG